MKTFDDTLDRNNEELAAVDQEGKELEAVREEGAHEEDWADNHTPLEVIKARVAAFVSARDWEKFHRPKDLAMALSVEAAELLQLFLWVDEDLEGGRPDPERGSVEAEMADVGICLLELSNRLGVDLARAIRRKLRATESKYPVAKAKGSALKYNEYEKK